MCLKINKIKIEILEFSLARILNSRIVDLSLFINFIIHSIFLNIEKKGAIFSMF